MDINTLRIAVTVAGFALFTALMVWTWMPRRRKAMDSAALLPFEGEAEEPRDE